MMTTTEDDDEESFGDFTFAPFVVNPIPKTNGSDLSNNDDDDWGDFVKPSSAFSRSESLPTKSFGSEKTFDPFSFFADRQNNNSQNDGSVPATEPDSAPSRIRTHFVKPKGALPLSLFGLEEKEEDKEEGSSAAGLLCTGATEVKPKTLTSDFNVTDLISNLYKQSEATNIAKLNSSGSGLNMVNSSIQGLISGSNALDLKRSVSNLDSNKLYCKGGVSSWSSNGSDLKSSVSNLDWDGWEYMGAEAELPARDLNIKSENAPPTLETKLGPSSKSNGINSSWNLFASDLDGLSPNLNLNVDGNKSSLVVDETEDFGDDDGWEFKVAEPGTPQRDTDSKVNGKGVEHTAGFGNDAALPTDLFVASDGISQKSAELNFGDVSRSSATPNGTSSNSMSDSKQDEDNLNDLISPPVNGNVDHGEKFWELKDASPQTGLKDTGHDVKLEKNKGALPLSFFVNGELETDNPLINQDSSTSSSAPLTRDETKTPGSDISISDLISSLYNQAAQNTSGKHMESSTANKLESTEKVVDSNLLDGGDDFDDDSWDFKDALASNFGVNKISTPANGDSSIKHSTKEEQKDYADFYSKLKDELCIVAQCHIDNLKKARSEAALCGEDAKVKAIEQEIQDLSTELHQHYTIAKEPHAESHQTGICLDEFVKILQEPKFHALETEYNLSKRLSLAEEEWRSCMELLNHVALTLKILMLGSKEEQSNYVSTWFKLVSVCAEELRHGASIWKQSLEKNIHNQILSDPRGKKYILSLGEIYRVVEVIGLTVKFYKPWLLLHPTDIFTLLSECYNLWSSSGLEEAFQSIFYPIGFVDHVTPKELLESVKSIQDLDVLTFHARVFSGQEEPTCRLSLLPEGAVPGMKMVIWNGEHYLLTLANLWANLISVDPPSLSHLHVG